MSNTVYALDMSLECQTQFMHWIDNAASKAMLKNLERGCGLEIIMDQDPCKSELQLLF